MKDHKTIAYFDCNTPEYGPTRLKYAVTVINRHCQKNSSLVDIGCGTGNTLEYLRTKTKLGNLCGIDVSQNCLSKCKETVGCDTFLGSILDSNFVERIQRTFDFVLLSAVLHHLIGKTRKKSKSYASLAIMNSLTLLKDKGYLIITEPTFYPSIAMDVLFYIKKFTTMMTSRRILILGKKCNIGAPIVSFYTNEQLMEMICRTKHCQIVETITIEGKIAFLWRFALITRRTSTTIVVRNARD